MHTLLKGTVQYEFRYLVKHYMREAGDFTFNQPTAGIANQECGYGEVPDQPGPLNKTVIRGDENYKLKHNVAQSRLGFFLSNYCPLF